MEIRKASAQDIDLLIAMRTAFLTEEHPELTSEQVGALKSTLADYFPRHLNRDFRAYLAETDGQTAAVVYMVVLERPANASLPSGKAATILNVYTVPAFRRRGLASALLREAMDDAGRLGVSVVDLQANAMGKPVYEKLGFMVRRSEYTPMEYRLSAANDV